MDEPDAVWMAAAVRLARQGACLGEVPVGAVLVRHGVIVGQAHNEVEARQNAAAHAEMLALEQACRTLGRWRLVDVTAYVTLEPCPMCAYAMVLARLDRLVFGALDPKRGAAGTLFDLVRHPALNHQLEVVGGVLAEEAGSLLREFFAGQRGGS
jgi:tRNA(adenine34) deaminase